MLQEANGNKQVIRTRSWIFEALMLLMDAKPYDKITISDICAKAGIARPTFYRNYKDKDDVVFECFRKTLTIAAEKTTEKTSENRLITLSFNFNYMVEHRKELKKILSNAEIEGRVFSQLQRFPESLIKQYKSILSAEEYLICRYKICYQIAGSMRVLFDWFENDMPVDKERLVEMLNVMATPRKVKYRNVPSIVVRINEQGERILKLGQK
ncbi:MAG: TetR/AcrR family transcriptional regulator [Spirochaetaceae bacterium]|nr:TetR/AcrR family transcriptional regulator [Spirochaetaceae bacterium]